MYDIFFISYNEPNADKNWQLLKAMYPFAKRIDGVKGIHAAHKIAANLSLTTMFWVVDADAVVKETFDFSFKVPSWDKDAVHVWYSENPINGLVYGYGGIKLLPKQLTLDSDTNNVDMTTSISSKFKVVSEVANVTEFNTDPFNTWKSAFRECAKLSSKIIDRQDSTESIERLDVWCNVSNGQYGEYAIEGAIAGRKYGEQNTSTDALAKINDFDWLQEEFSKVSL